MGKLIALFILSLVCCSPNTRTVIAIERVTDTLGVSDTLVLQNSFSGTAYSGNSHWIIPFNADSYPNYKLYLSLDETEWNELTMEYGNSIGVAVLEAHQYIKLGDPSKVLRGGSWKIILIL